MTNNNMIILQNKSNSGKTSTLRELANILISKTRKYKILEGNLNKGDFIIEIEYNSKKIIIISMGDTAKSLEKKYKEVWDKCENIDIIFGACRTKGKTISEVKKQAVNHNFNIIWTSTYEDEKNEKILNQKRAQELFNTFC